jgi:hypothetical protein
LANYIRIRASPDWLVWDPEDSRAFCRNIGVPETLIVDYVSLWNSAFRVDYRRFRHELKRIASATLSRVKNAALATNLPALNDGDLVAFTDDDDWLAPDLFEHLRGSGEGFRWGSVRLGPVFANPAEPAYSTIYHLRPVDRLVYSNNYAATGRAIKRLGVNALLEHWNAQRRSDALLWKRWRPASVPHHLSVANKNPCSTVAAKFFLAQDSFRRDPRAVIAGYAEELEGVRPLPWIEEPLAQYRQLVRSALG